MLKLEDYEPIVGPEIIERILHKARGLRDRSIVNVSSTYYGGGVAAKLTSLVLLMNSAGIRTGWRIIQGRQDFFGITKRMHNALQGGLDVFTDEDKAIYEEVNEENAIRNHLDHDFVVVHDPQPLPLVEHYRKRSPWVWRCHIDLTHPHPQLWDYLRRFVQQFDAVIMSIPEYAQDIRPSQFFHMPAIDPFTEINRYMSDEEVDRRLAQYGIPTDLPIIVQVSRFDKWKDPQGVIDAFRIARKEAPCTLILKGNSATDDPEGALIYNSILDQQDERIILINNEDVPVVNALQRKAAVVIQKSLREGFGLTVTEAMWKGTPVIGGNVGGIRYQITDGVSGFLVNNVQETADRIVTLLKNPDLRRKMGQAGHETVKKNFLMTRLVEEYLNLFNSFEISIKIRGPMGVSTAVSVAQAG